MAPRAFVRYAFLPREPVFTPQEAIKLSRERAHAGATSCPHHGSVLGMCAHNVGCNYGFATCGAGDAISLWRGLPEKYRRRGIEPMLQAPAGSLLFWSGGSEGHGHAGIADGEGKVFCTDRPASGRFGRVPIGDIQATWGLKPEGWAFPFFEAAPSDVREPPKLATAQPERQTPNIDAIIRSGQDTIAAAKRAITARERPADAKVLRKIVDAARDQITLAKPLQGSRPQAGAH
jgi:hypothetical protein